MQQALARAAALASGMSAVYRSDLLALCKGKTFSSRE
jgi:hypothetical protein